MGEQVLRGFVAGFAPEHDLRQSPGLNPGEGGVHERSSGALVTLSLDDKHVVDEPARTAQVPPARPFDSREHVPHDFIRALRDQNEIVGVLKL